MGKALHYTGCFNVRKIISDSSFMIVMGDRYIYHLSIKENERERRGWRMSGLRSKKGFYR